MTKLIAAVLGFAPALVFAADILTTWQPVTNDDSGSPLPTPVDEYRVKDCADTVLSVVTPGNPLEYREVGGGDGLTSGASICRRVTAYRAPFESAPADGVYVAIVPGQTTVSTSVVP